MCYRLYIDCPSVFLTFNQSAIVVVIFVNLICCDYETLQDMHKRIHALTTFVRVTFVKFHNVLKNLQTK